MNKNDDAFRILIVDDNNELRAILKEYLNNDADIVDGAQDGREALNKHEKTPYDLIITDLNMPGLTGMELIRTIRGSNGMTEFIIITGYASLDTAVEAIKIGAFDYIVKPFRMEELKVVVKNAKDKIMLKKANMELLSKLKALYNEIEKYEQHVRIERSQGENLGRSGLTSDTERLLREIENVKRFGKGRLMIE
jgi:DNA-binding NtrC family response regulator